MAAILDGTLDIQYSSKKEERGFYGNDGYKNFCTEGFFGVSRCEVRNVTYSLGKVTIHFNVSHEECVYTHESGADVGRIYKKIDDGNYEISFRVPSDEEDLNEIKLWIMKKKRFTNLTRIYSSYTTGCDKIILNERLEGFNTCTHYWHIPKNEVFSFTLKRV